jgi:hypothetical protein
MLAALFAALTMTVFLALAGKVSWYLRTKDDQ